jgi:hypothetical protein
VSQKNEGSVGSLMGTLQIVKAKRAITYTLYKLFNLVSSSMDRHSCHVAFSKQSEGEMGYHVLELRGNCIGFTVAYNPLADKQDI